MDIATILTGVLVVVSAVFGGKWAFTKKTAKEVVSIAKSVIDAVEDDKVTENEVKEVAKKAKGIINSKKV